MPDKHDSTAGSSLSQNNDNYFCKDVHDILLYYGEVKVKKEPEPKVVIPRTLAQLKKAARQRTKRDPLCNAFALGRGDGMWPFIVKLLDNVSHLIVLSMTNRTLHNSIWYIFFFCLSVSMMIGFDPKDLRSRGNHRLMRIIYSSYFFWNPAAAQKVCCKTFEIPDQLYVWNPLQSWVNSEVPDELKNRFNSYVHKLCVMYGAPWCSLCHEYAAPGDNHVLSIWTLGMRLCRKCVFSHFASNKVLFHRYGIRLSEQFVVGDKQEKRQKSLMRILVDSKVFFFNTSGNEKQRRNYSVAIEDFKDIPNTLHVEMLMVYMPHLKKVVDLTKAYKYMQERKNAARFLCRFLKSAPIMHLKEQDTLFSELRAASSTGKDAGSSKECKLYMEKVENFRLGSSGRGKLGKSKLDDLVADFFLGWRMNGSDRTLAASNECLCMDT